MLGFLVSGWRITPLKTGDTPLPHQTTPGEHRSTPGVKARQGNARARRESSRENGDWHGQLPKASPHASVQGSTWEGAEREMCIRVMPTAHQHGVEDGRLLLALTLRHHLPLPAAGEVGALGHAAHAGLGAGGALSGTLCPLFPLPPPPRAPALTLKRMWRSRSKCWAYMRKYSMILELCM